MVDDVKREECRNVKNGTDSNVTATTVLKNLFQSQFLVQRIQSEKTERKPDLGNH